MLFNASVIPSIVSPSFCKAPGGNPPPGAFTFIPGRLLFHNQVKEFAVFGRGLDDFQRDRIFPVRHSVHSAQAFNGIEYAFADAGIGGAVLTE